MGSETKRDVPENIVAEAKIPRGGIAHHVVLTRSEVILLGTPDNEEGNEDDLAHNCDAMGCGMDHVLVRIPLRATPTPAADGEGLAVLAVCHCAEYYGSHPSDCPARLQYEAALRARSLPDDVRAVVERVQRMFAGRDSFLRHEEYDAEEIDAEHPVTFADLRLLLAHLQRTEG